MTVYSFAGKKVKTFSRNPLRGFTEIPVSGLRAGTYLLECERGGLCNYLWFVKQ
jgi:hypothetical protein